MRPAASTVRTAKPDGTKKAKTIGTAIRDARLRKNMTQRQVGDVVGVTPAAVSVWETGISLPKDDRWERLCTVLGLRPDMLFNLRTAAQLSGRLPTTLMTTRRAAGRGKLARGAAAKPVVSSKLGKGTARGRRVPVFVSPYEMRMLEGHRHASRNVRAEVARALSI